MCISFLTSQFMLAQAPNNSYIYAHDPNLINQFSDATVNEKFVASTSFATDGVVQFQAIRNNSSNAIIMQVTVTDDNGAVVRNDFYTLPGGQDMVPNACSYNSVIRQYIVTGVSGSPTGFNSFGSWYMLFDEDMNPLGLNFFELASNNISTTSNTFGPTQSTFVTDVCPVYTQQPNRHFAFTGVILENGNDPGIRNDFMNPPSERRLFISILDAINQTMLLQHEYYFELLFTPVDITRYTYPSRIIEVKSSTVGNNRGFLVAGTTYSNAPTVLDAKSFFYLRTDNDLLLFDHKVVDNITGPDTEIFAVGDLFQENNADDILVAGTVTNFSSNYATQYYFFDKLINITSTTSVMSYLDAWPTNGVSPIPQMGVYRMPNTLPKLQGFPKVGRISAPNLQGGFTSNRISGSFCRNHFYVSSNTGLYTDLLPNLFEVDYSDAALDFWSTSQNSSFDLYPRLNGMNGPVPYFSAHSFSSPWFPNKISFEFSNIDNQHVLGGQGLDPLTNGNYNVLNHTDRPFTGNNCTYDMEIAQRELMPVNVSTFNILESAITNNQIGYPINVDFFNAPLMTDCATNAFKSNTLSGLSIQDYTLHISNSTIQFKSKVHGNSIVIYNSVGSVITKIEETDQLNYSLSHLPNGIYILKIVDAKGKLVETRKLTIQ